MCRHWRLLMTDEEKRCFLDPRDRERDRDTELKGERDRETERERGRERESSELWCLFSEGH